MAERCQRCMKPVYFAEELRALGRKWHKLCLKCASCNKLLDSTTCTDHQGEAFCKACYGKNFGPKGYGFAGGASGLSANSTTKYGQVDGINNFVKAVSAPLLQTPASWAARDACLRCGHTVYYAEEVRAMGRKWHKICLSCGHCGKPLDSSTCTDHDGDIFCRNCYGKLFGPKGYGYAGGAMLLSMDTGRPYEIPLDNVSHYAQAQAAPVINGGGGNRFGGGEKCPRCQKTVFFAEEARANGRKWHKLCLKCANCNKMLDSTTCTDHDGEAYCKACYGRMFGPKGYGFAGGASGLSMDTGRAGEITTENVSRLAMAQAAPLIEGNIQQSKYGGAELCGRCGKQVYFAEQVIGGGNTYHKACFKCSACGKNLDSTTLTQNDGSIFCKACYGKHFGPKGFGFGQALQHTA
ncbi:muscle LIM protein Mlp84B-like [Ylistrum balloti]|uniref:muscle LIM protein Mlp84B-like n=1 Tax=Ylistrum balloti TaxID=509963 RepID=UPI002905D608|nr:muscle LIM protein Mlp84B-like [Ylistrum balloti]